MPVPADPRAEYTRRLDDRRARHTRYARLDNWTSNVRLALLAVIALVAWLAWRDSLAAAWLSAPVVVFGGLVAAHQRIAGQRQHWARAVAFYEQGLARLDHTWMGRGTDGERFLDDRHLYAADLDLFGSGSVFELLCTARTIAGENALAAWLLSPAPPEVVHARQEAVRELTPRLDLREDLALIGSDVRAGLHPQFLENWAAEAPRLVSPVLRVAAAGLAAATVTAAGLWWAGVAGASWTALGTAAGAAFAWPLRSRVLHVIGAADGSSHELALLAGLLGRLEREAFGAPLLQRLQTDLLSAGQPPSQRIAALRRLIDLLDARRNQLFAPVSYLLLWGTQFACAIEAWRTVSGPAVARWLTAVGEFEALCALSAFAYEEPDAVFPAVIDGDAGPLFDGEALGHPLLPASSNVRNDVRLAGAGHGDGPRALVVSGSNMSGKSTLLRTVGVSAVLAMAGAPVRARRLTLTPLAIGATLRIQDSLHAGTSRFYAEITRLRAIVDLADRPVAPLFLLDEMLNGTNSRDRRAGADALVRGLIRRGAVGLVTTHDLSLTEIADALAPLARNVHFEDHLEDGRIMFDYQCRPGVVTRSNALALMRAVGLDL